jgi:L-fucose isomerase-like protein
MIPIHIAYLPLGRPTFDMETAGRYVEESKRLLAGAAQSYTAPEGLLVSPEETAAFLRKALAEHPLEALVVQTTTFVDARFIQEIMDAANLPILLWGVREPRVNGSRLALNSMTGINNLSNTLVARCRKFALLFGNPTEEALAAELRKQLKVVRLVRELQTLKIGVLGKQPDGFFFSAADRDALARIGPQLIELDLQEAFRRADEVPEAGWQATLAGVRSQVRGLEAIPPEGVRKFAQMQTALLEQVKAQGISMVAVRCWPEFFTEFGAAACSTVSSFIESGFMASCEADIHGAITMHIQHRLAGSAPYLGDLVHIDESKDSGVFWHCGAGAFSLARTETGAQAGLHPNRKLGFTMEFGLKPGRVSINRLGPDPFAPGRYRMLNLAGEALDEPQKFWGTSVVVGFGQPVLPLFRKLMIQGWEPHYSIIYEDIRDEIRMLCEWLDVSAIDL